MHWFCPERPLESGVLCSGSDAAPGGAFRTSLLLCYILSCIKSITEITCGEIQANLLSLDGTRCTKMAALLLGWFYPHPTLQLAVSAFNGAYI